MAPEDCPWVAEWGQHSFNATLERISPPNERPVYERVFVCDSCGYRRINLPETVTHEDEDY